MKITTFTTKSVEAFGTGYSIITEFTAELIDGTVLNGSVNDEITDEKIFLNKTKKIIAERLISSCVAMKEILNIMGDITITVGGEDMAPEGKNVSFLDFWNIQSHESSTQITRFIVDNFTEEIEKLYCEVKPLMNNPQYEDYYDDADYFYGKGISLKDYAELVDNGEAPSPIKIKRVDLGREDIKMTQEITGGANFNERLEVAAERVSTSIYNDELLLEGDRVLIIRRRD